METLQTQFDKSRKLRQAVMRRVWYVFVLSIVLRPALIFGFVFGASAIAFWRLASITSIIQNLLTVEVGDLPWYAADAFMQADTWSLLAFVGLMIAGSVMVIQMSRGLLAADSWRIAQ